MDQRRLNRLTRRTLWVLLLSICSAFQLRTMSVAAEPSNVDLQSLINAVHNPDTPAQSFPGHTAAEQVAMWKLAQTMKILAVAQTYEQEGDLVRALAYYDAAADFARRLGQDEGPTNRAKRAELRGLISKNGLKAKAHPAIRDPWFSNDALGEAKPSASSGAQAARVPNSVDPERRIQEEIDSSQQKYPVPHSQVEKDEQDAQVLRQLLNVAKLYEAHGDLARAFNYYGESLSIVMMMQGGQRPTAEQSALKQKLMSLQPICESPGYVPKKYKFLKDPLNDGPSAASASKESTSVEPTELQAKPSRDEKRIQFLRARLDSIKSRIAANNETLAERKRSAGRLEQIMKRNGGRLVESDADADTGSIEREDNLRLAAESREVQQELTKLEQVEP